MPANKKLLILPGDGIGPEVMREVRRVIDWMARRRMVSFDMSEDLVGGASIDARGTPIRVDGRSEVIPHGAAVGHVDRLSSSDREERHVAEVGHASHIACCVALDVLVQERVDRGRHEKHCGSHSGAGQCRDNLLRRQASPCVRPSSGSVR